MLCVGLLTVLCVRLLTVLCVEPLTVLCVGLLTRAAEQAPGASVVRAARRSVGTTVRLWKVNVSLSWRLRAVMERFHHHYFAWSVGIAASMSLGHIIIAIAFFFMEHHIGPEEGVTDSGH